MTNEELSMEVIRTNPMVKRGMYAGENIELWNIDIETPCETVYEIDNRLRLGMSRVRNVDTGEWRVINVRSTTVSSPSAVVYNTSSACGECGQNSYNLVQVSSYGSITSTRLLASVIDQMHDRLCLIHKLTGGLA